MEWTRAADQVAAKRQQLDAFLKQVERRALRMAELATQSRDDALDIVQDAMLVFVRNYQDKPSNDWVPLFYRVLDSRLTDYHRRHQVRSRWLAWLPVGRDQDDDGDALAELPDPADVAPWQRIADGETGQALDSALKALPGRQRQAFLLRVWEGLDVADTARAMGCGEGSVKTHLSRAMAALRTRLEAYHG
ncbi:RNA polymerase sigma factor [Ahniella affigens]|uniref:RNA polymerase sigma factor n=2 Tax=Ahniella affigens TaxID=2021234 RepID=A0A2P1PZF9_9GAMM|nr:RNA polymerase sigma factor [Ahniella affigens]